MLNTPLSPFLCPTPCPVSPATSNMKWAGSYQIQERWEDAAPENVKDVGARLCFLASLLRHISHTMKLILFKVLIWRQSVVWTTTQTTPCLTSRESKAPLLSNLSWAQEFGHVCYVAMLFAVSLAFWPMVLRFLIIFLFTSSSALGTKVPKRLCHQVPWYSASMDLLSLKWRKKGSHLFPNI